MKKMTLSANGKAVPFLFIQLLAVLVFAFATTVNAKGKPCNDCLPATQVDNYGGYDSDGLVNEVSPRFCMGGAPQPNTGTAGFECDVGQTLTIAVGANWSKEPAGRKGGDGRYCDYLNSLGSFVLRPTRYWYHNFGCTEGFCEIKVGHSAFNGDTAPWNDAHPFHGSDFPLPDIGLLRSAAFADVPALEDDLNPFAADRVLDIHTIWLKFSEVGKSKIVATCQATFDVDNPAVDRPLFYTECIGDDCRNPPSP